MRNRLVWFTIALSCLPGIAQTPAKRSAPPPKKQEVASIPRIMARQLAKDAEAALSKNQLEEAERKFYEAVGTLGIEEVCPEAMILMAGLSELYARQGRTTESIDAGIAAFVTGQRCANLSEECAKSKDALTLRAARLLLHNGETQAAEPLARAMYNLGREGGLKPEERRLALHVYLRYLETSSQPAQAAVIRDQIQEQFGKPGGSALELAPVFPQAATAPATKLTSPIEKQGAFETLFRCSAANGLIGRNTRAEANLKAAIALAGRDPDFDRLRLLSAGRAMANFYADRQRWDDAITVTRSMLAIAKENAKPGDGLVPRIQLDLGLQLANKRENAESIAEFEAAEAAARKCTDRKECDPLEATIRCYKALTMFAAGQAEQAEAILKALVSDPDKKLPDNHFAPMVKAYAGWLRAYGRDDEAKVVEALKR